MHTSDRYHPSSRKYRAFPVASPAAPMAIVAQAQGSQPFTKWSAQQRMFPEPAGPDRTGQLPRQRCDRDEPHRDGRDHPAAGQPFVLSGRGRLRRAAVLHPAEHGQERGLAAMPCSSARPGSFEGRGRHKPTAAHRVLGGPVTSQKYVVVRYSQAAKTAGGRDVADGFGGQAAAVPVPAARGGVP
jgi:hypothetical protein